MFFVGSLKTKCCMKEILKRRSRKRIVVIKVGTEVLQNRRAFLCIARQAILLKAMGFGVIIVTSGAVAAGRHEIAAVGDTTHFIKGDIASIGALLLLLCWAKVFAPQFKIAQFWIEHSHFRNKWKRRRLRISLRRFAFSRCIPIVNENDVVSSVEIVKMTKKGGDNDPLSRIVAVLVDAYCLALVTKAGGVYNKDPERHLDAKLYPTLSVRKALPKGKRRTHKNGNSIQSKKREACIAFKKGIRAGIIGTWERCAIIKLATGKQAGTIIVA